MSNPVATRRASAAGHGRVRVANDVVAAIAALAAREVKGVVGLCHHSGGPRGGDSILRNGSDHKGVKVEVLDDLSLVLDVSLALDGVRPVSQVGPEVQNAVATVVSRMVGLKVREVNLHVREVVL